MLADGAEAAIVPADLGKPEAVVAAHRDVVAALGDPEILVNNAGWNIGPRHWRDMSVEGMSGVIDVDLKAPFACSIAVLPAMRAKRRGTLIHVSSLAAFSFNVVSGGQLHRRQARHARHERQPQRRGGHQRHPLDRHLPRRGGDADPELPAEAADEPRSAT